MRIFGTPYTVKADSDTSQVGDNPSISLTLLFTISPFLYIKKDRGVNLVSLRRDNKNPILWCMYRLHGPRYILTQGSLKPFPRS